MPGKNVLKRKNKTLAIIAFFLIATFAVAYVYLPQVSTIKINSGTSMDVTDADGDGSVFQRYTDKQDDTSEQEVTSLELMRILESKDESYWQDWTYEDKMVLGVIQEVDIANNQMKIIITLPKGRVFSDINRIAYVDCSLGKSGLIKGSEAEQTEQERGVDILRTAAPQDRLYAYCLDEGCLNLGDVCILTDMSL